VYFNPSWSHAHSAFVVALFIWYWDATREHRSLAQWLVLGVIVGLMLDVYYLNLMIVSVVVVEAAAQYLEMFRSGRLVASNLLALSTRHLLFSCVVLVMMLPTFLTRWIVYGGPFKTGYLSIRDFLWESPVFLDVLISSNHGLLSWTPLAAFAIIGLLFFAIRLPKIGVPFFTALVALYLFISYYPDWAGISSYGNRFFISVTPLFILGLAYLLERIAACFERPCAALAVSAGMLACFVLWNLGLIYQWGVHLVPARGPISFREAAHNQIFVVPAQISSQLRSYLFRRSEMMRQIEQRDLEQLKSIPER
jgi:hypothetical protein